MTAKNAHMFVEKMKKDKGFRNTLQNFQNQEELWEYLKEQGYAFDECDLINAMASCMAGMDEMNK